MNVLQPLTEDFAELKPWQREALATLGRRANQQRRVYVYLCLYGRTGCRRLEQACKVRSVTSRMTELRRRGLIASVRGFEPDDDGTPQRTAIYSVREPSPQLGLFDPA